MKRYLPELIRKARILVLLGITYLIAELWHRPTFAMLFLAYWIMCDITDIEVELLEQKERREEIWNNILPTRKPF